MRNYRYFQNCLAVALLALLGLAAAPAVAQLGGNFQLSGDQPGLPGFGGPQLGEGDRVPKLEAGITAPGPDHAAQLFIVATMPAGAHTYSITQPDGGPIRTQIKISPTADVPTIGKFRPVEEPEVKHDEDAFPKIPLEEQSGTVKWFAPIQLAPGAKPETIKLDGKVKMQLCDANGCAMPKDYAFSAAYRPDVPAEKPPAEHQAPPAATEKPAATPAPAAPPANPPQRSEVPLTVPTVPPVMRGQGGGMAKLEAGFTTPTADGSSQLFIRATIPPGMNTYSITQLPGGPIATTIEIEKTAARVRVGEFRTLTPATIVTNKDLPGLLIEEHLGSVTWVAPIKFGSSDNAAAERIRGNVTMQLCIEGNSCMPPTAYNFDAGLNANLQPVEMPAIPQPLRAAAPPNPLPQPANAEGEIEWLPVNNAAELREIVGPSLDLDLVHDYVRKQDDKLGLLGAIFGGFFGGLILNVMPCVFPVIGLKILSFVQQSGHSRSKALMLNVCYSAGLIAVFVVLASLAVLMHLGWGELFGMSWFTIGLAAIVFVMALSFMGIWEVPLPTFLGGGKTGELARQEGPAGAFFKGVVMTFLATPCSGPLFAPAVAWATSQPPAVTFTVFIAAGLGMASPYLLIGAFPALVRFLPRPGAWMETFKQVMGFVLIGMAVYLLAVMKPHLAVPTVGFLASLAFMCWWAGRVTAEKPLSVKLRAWALGGSIAAATWILMFPGLDTAQMGPFRFRGLAAATAPVASPVNPTPTKLSAARFAGKKTVLVDFTAVWCQNCHLFENTVLRTEPVVNAIKQHDVLTLKADWTDVSPEIGAMLESLNSKQIPVIAIFPLGDPNRPIVFRGAYTQAQILEALDKAGPSLSSKVALR